MLLFAPVVRVRMAVCYAHGHTRVVVRSRLCRHGARKKLVEYCKMANRSLILYAVVPQRLCACLPASLLLVFGA